jgi:uncharacterized OB-fold protein
MHRLPAVPRTPPLLDDSNRDFWTGGLSGELRMWRCQACGWWVHPPAPVCRNCLSRALRTEVLSGRATVMGFTINRHHWNPETAPDPFVIAMVELDEQEGLRLTTNIVNIPPEEVSIGMRVRVVFEQLEDVAVPLFEPDG